MLLALALDAATVLSNYAAALDESVQPPAVVFSYTVSQAGPRNLEQTHTIYRAGTRQRDETTAVDGDPVKPHAIRIFARADRYAVTRIAPRPGTYAFTYKGTRRDGKHLVYVFATSSQRVSAFTVTSVAIDGLTYLPSAISYRASFSGGRASGVIAYAKVVKYWLPLSATASATINGHAATERITWSGYRFPLSLPASTFEQPKALPSPSASPL